MKIQIVSFLDLPYELCLKTRLWRNSPNVSQYFRLKNISEEEHIRWLDCQKKSRPSVIAFMIYCDDIPVGVTYFHSISYKLKTADWGIYIYSTEYHGKGVGSYALKYSMEFARCSLNLHTIFLDVLPFNNKAIVLYEKNGFKRIGAYGDDDLYYRYKKEL